MAKPIRILGIAGSLRARSYNRALLRAAQALAPEGLQIDAFERLGDIPPYNEDVEAKGDPEPVAAFKRAIAEHDGLLFVSPEYNYSIPGVLKNAIDWASRPPPASPLKGKPAGVMGASPGGFGTVRGQMALRQSLQFPEVYLMLKPEVMVSRAQDKFDGSGNLTDEATKKVLRTYLEALAVWVRRFAPA